MAELDERWPRPDKRITLTNADLVESLLLDGSFVKAEYWHGSSLTIRW